MLDCSCGAGQKQSSKLDSTGLRMVWIYSRGTSSSATMLMILISGLIAGPAVSL